MKRDLQYVALPYWTVEEVFARLGGDEGSAARTCLDLRLDGSCLTDVTEDLLKALFVHEGQREAVLRLRSEGTRTFPVDPDSLMKEQSPLMGKCFAKFMEQELENQRAYDRDRLEASALKSPIDVVRRFHQTTSNSAKAASPTLARDWNSQPRPWRRFVGANVQPLAINPSGDDRLASVMLFAASVTAKTFKPTRPQGTKRVNPSSGALHPGEIYVLQPTTPTSCRVGHYVPNEHAMEWLRASPVISASGDSMLIFGLASIRERETWKYGARGSRYTSLDLGHLLASLMVSLSRLAVSRFAILDAATVEGANAAFCLEQWKPHSATVEASSVSLNFAGREALELIVVASWDGTEDISDIACGLIRECAAGAVALSLPVHKNAVFSCALRNCTGLWAWMEAQQSVCWEARRNKHTKGAVFAKHEDAGVGFAQLPTGGLLDGVILGRRSELSFDSGRAISSQLFQSIVDAAQAFGDLSSPWRSLFPSLVVGFTVMAVEGMAPARYLFAPAGSRLQHHMVEEEGKLCKIPYEGSVETLREEASHSSCRQKIALECSLVISLFIHSPLFCTNDCCCKSPPLSGVEEYEHAHWACGYFGHLIYLLCTACGASVSGMGCFLDDMTAALFGGSNGSLTALYNLAVGIGNSQHHPPAYHYEDRLE